MAEGKVKQKPGFIKELVSFLVVITQSIQFSETGKRLNYEYVSKELFFI